jgi:hypothetical protein
MSTMPGLPTRPCFYDIDLDTATGKVIGLSWCQLNLMFHVLLHMLPGPTFSEGQSLCVASVWFLM